MNKSVNTTNGESRSARNANETGNAREREREKESMLTGQQRPSTKPCGRCRKSLPLSAFAINPKRSLPYSKCETCRPIHAANTAASRDRRVAARKAEAGALARARASAGSSSNEARARTAVEQAAETVVATAAVVPEEEESTEEAETAVDLEEADWKHNTRDECQFLNSILGCGGSSCRLQGRR